MTEEKVWRKYERDILKHLKAKFPDCKFDFDDSIFGQFSKVDRQVDISFRGNIAGNKILGIVDCKFSEKTAVDVKTVESFLGMLEDINANIGIIITNQSYSQAAKNRASVKSLKLDVVSLAELKDLQFDYDDIINRTINNLKLSKSEFFERNIANTVYFDPNNSSYSKRIISFKKGFVNTEYYVFKKVIKESARSFRDFPQISEITIQIPVIISDGTTNWEEEERLYSAKIIRYELERYLNLDFWELRQDIKKWRSEFLENPVYTKESIYEFAKKNIKYKLITAYDNG